MKKVFIYLFNGYSDWEIAYLTPEINKNDQFELVYFSNEAEKVTSMGGLVVEPDISINEVKVDDIDLLILPGGTSWETEENSAIKNLIQKVHTEDKTIAAICAATCCLAQLGILNNIAHTSNALEYLKAIAPDYSGEKTYKNELVVTDSNVITACGIASIEFAKDVFKAINLYPDEQIEDWFQLFKHGIWKG
ncbi:glutamine amidotransferase [Prolixibacteraceae bacterium JC049]|nr:glutamine amidotransferase [Prolixibacteraceae bacterium JC049]